MKTKHIITALACTVTFTSAHAQVPIAPSITTPDKVETRIGTLDFKDGAPSKETLDKVYDNLDFTHAFEAFVNTFQGVNMAAARKGLLDIGVKDNEIALFSELMDAKSLFLTANADTVYFFGFIDLTKGPMVFETPPGALGTLDDMWWRWVIDFGLPGPDRGMGGKYLLLPPGYDGPVPEGGFFVARARTTRVVILGRLFMENNDPKPAADAVRKFTKLYPYEAGGVGTPIAEFLDGKARLGRLSEPPPTVFHEVSGKSFSTIPPNDFTYYEMLNEVVQQEPATSLDPELMGPLAAIGIIKGKPFAPDARMKKIMTEALALANATSRSLLMNPRDPSWYLLSRLGVVEHAVHQRLRVRDAHPDDRGAGPGSNAHSRRCQTVPDHRLPPVGCAHQLLLRRHRHHARDGHAHDRHRLAVPVRVTGCRQELFRRLQDLQVHAAQGRSG